MNERWQAPHTGLPSFTGRPLRCAPACDLHEHLVAAADSNSASDRAGRWIICSGRLHHQQEGDRLELSERGLVGDAAVPFPTSS